MLNQCQFIGNLGADPDVKRTQAGNPVVNFSVAVTERWKDKNSGEKRERTEWVRVVVFSEGLCKVAESYLKKGSRVFVSGKLSSRKWQDQSGQDRYTTEIVLQGFDAKLIMLDSRQSDSGSQDNNQNSAGDYAKQSGGSYQAPLGNEGSFGGGDFSDEIPFAPEWRG